MYNIQGSSSAVRQSSAIALEIVFENENYSAVDLLRPPGLQFL